MKDDTRKELERIEKELLAQDEAPAVSRNASGETQELDSIIAEFSAPAFDDPMEIHEPKEPMVYRNFSNDYGKELQDSEKAGGEAPQKAPDKVVIGLMLGVCGLCLGIIGVLAYWLNAFL